MISHNKLTEYLDKLLDSKNFNDYAPNGLQIEGRETIKQICTAVTASAEVIQEAIALKADALLVHHGYFWRGEAPQIVGIKRKRIAELLSNNINLFAYHLPLDCHPKLGNNACLANLLALDVVEMHSVEGNANLLWSGSWNEPKTVTEFVDSLEKNFLQKPLHIASSQQTIKRLAWCSGAAQGLLEKAHILGVDAYISGEVSERTFYEAHELDIHYFACGHHATERYGVQALGEHIAGVFDLQHQFIDSHNPL